MSSDMTTAAEMASDYLIFHLAAQAGVKIDDAVEEVDEVYLETVDIEGYGMEVWTRFLARGLDGQTYMAHLPGRLDEHLARVIRDHALVFAGSE